MTSRTITFVIDDWTGSWSELDDVLNSMYYEFEVVHKVNIHSIGMSGGDD